ncbi:MAG: hypothetical protein JXB49_12860 [Bacteroidales bacterium]|nr:hypothetical protein [Bacteroidales bacterium]
MKRITSILFSLFYLLVSAGIMVNFHYCHGTLASVKIFTDKGNCGCNSTMDNNGCCKNETYVVQLKDDQQASQNAVIIPDLPVVDILVSETTSNSINKVFSINNLRFYDLPPPERPSKFILNCSLTYYG